MTTSIAFVSHSDTKTIDVAIFYNFTSTKNTLESVKKSPMAPLNSACALETCDVRCEVPHKHSETITLRSSRDLTRHSDVGGYR